MAAQRIGSLLAKGLGIELDTYEENIPSDVIERVTSAISPFEPFMEEMPTTKQWILEQVPSRHDIVPYFLSFFPFTKWLGRYNLRWLAGDVIAGVTLGLVIVPQALSYALLANLSPEYGLYTSFTGASLYWLFGTSKDIAIGATAVVSLLVGKTGDHVRELRPEFTREEIAKTHAFLAGCVLLVFGLLRLDWIIEFIPHVAISAFVTGAAITISLSQLPTLLGIDGVNSKGPAYQVFIDVCGGLDRTKLDAAVGLSALILLSFVKWLCEYMAKRRPHQGRMWSTISSLRLTFTILLYTFISFLVHRNVAFEDSRFRILGQLPVGFSHAGPPTFQPKLLSALLPELPATVIILIIEHIAIGKSFGRINGYTVIPSQELISIAATNLTGPFVGAYASTGSFGGTAILSKAGVRTPLAGVFNGVILLLALYALTAVLYYIPMASLAALIIHAVVNLITSPDHLYKTWLISPPDVVIYFVGVFVAIFTNLENGIYATVALSAALLLLRLARARGRFLGRVRIHRHPNAGRDTFDSCTTTDYSHEPPSTDGVQSIDIFLPLDREDSSNSLIEVESPHPGMFIYRFTEGFNYLNQAQYMDSLLDHVMNETRRSTVVHYDHPGDRPWNEPNPPNSSKVPDQSDAESIKPTLKAIILDCSAVNNMDSGAIEGLMNLRDQLGRWAAPDIVQWHFACVNSRWTRRALAMAGFGCPNKQELANTDCWKPVFSLAEETGQISEGRPPATTNTNIKGPEKGAATANTVPLHGHPMAAVHGINRPNFHVDLALAVESATQNITTKHYPPEIPSPDGDGVVYTAC